MKSYKQHRTWLTSWYLIISLHRHRFKEDMCCRHKAASLSSAFVRATETLRPNSQVCPYRSSRCSDQFSAEASKQRPREVNVPLKEKKTTARDQLCFSLITTRWYQYLYNTFIMKSTIADLWLQYRSNRFLNLGYWQSQTDISVAWYCQTILANHWYISAFSVYVAQYAHIWRLYFLYYKSLKRWWDHLYLIKSQWSLLCQCRAIILNC